MERYQWYALKCRAEFQLRERLAPEVDTIFLPSECKETIDGRRVMRAIIPGVIFIFTDRDNALRLERLSRSADSDIPPFWIYRYSADPRPVAIPPRDINLLRLLTARDATRCEVYAKKDFESGQRVRITGGIFKGLEGHVQRVKKNRHVVIRIEGICALLLPFIHPDLLQHLPD